MLSIEEYLASLAEPRQSEMRALHQFIRDAAPALTFSCDHRMIGYGPFHYKYASGREGDAFLLGLASGKSGISIYILACDQGGYLVEQAGSQLGKAQTGKSCIRFKKLTDVHLDVIEKLIKKAITLGGTGAVSEY